MIYRIFKINLVPRAKNTSWDELRLFFIEFPLFHGRIKEYTMSIPILLKSL